MKKTLLLAAFAAAIITLAGCQKESLDIQPQSGNGLVFTAAIESGNTRTTIDADKSSPTKGKVSWENGDEITITDGSDNTAIYETDGVITNGKATFTFKSGTTLGAGPYTATYGQAPLTAQTYSATAGDLPMTAPSTESTDLRFHITCGLLKVTLTKADESIKSIAVTGTPQGGSETTYTLTCSEAKDITSATDFFIALPAGNYNKFVFTNGSDVTCTKTATSGNEIAIVPNKIQPISFSSALNFEFSVCATVGSQEYSDLPSALEALKAYNGSDETVTLKLCKDETFNPGTFAVLKNNAGKPVIFDLNGHTLSTDVAPLFTVLGTVTVTDESGTGLGKISSSPTIPLISNDKRIFRLFDDCTLNIKKCTLYSTGTGAYIDTLRSIISVNGTEGKSNGVLNISDGAKIINDGYMKGIYVRYGNINTSNCEISSLKTYSTGGYHNLYLAIGAYAHIYEGSSFYVTTEQSSSGNTSGTNIYAAVKTVKGLVVESGTWFYSIKGINCGGANDEYYDGRIQIKGGYFYPSKLINPDKDATHTAIVAGKSYKQLETPVHHTHNGMDLEYGYVIN